MVVITEKTQIRRNSNMASYVLILLRLLLLLVVVAATDHASQWKLTEDSTLLADDATESRTETGDWRLSETSAVMTTAALKTLTSADGVTSLTDTVGTQPSEDRLEEGRHLMERFYQRYKTTPQVDLVFVLDRSGSVPRKGWHAVIEFVKVGAVRP